MGNFDFLKDDFKNLYDIAYEMEYELLNFRPKSSVCFGSRFFEELLREIYRINPELGKSTFMNPYAMINNLYEKGGISKEIKNKFDEVRRLRNRIIHNDPTTGMALEFNEANFRLAIWFYSRYVDDSFYKEYVPIHENENEDEKDKSIEKEGSKYFIYQGHLKFGPYDNSEDVGFIWNLLSYNDWDIDQLARISVFSNPDNKLFYRLVSENGNLIIDEKSPERLKSIKNNEGIIEIDENEFAINISGFNLGSFDSRQDASFIRDLLENNNWNIPKLLEEDVYNKENGYYYRLEMGDDFKLKIAFKEKRPIGYSKYHGENILESDLGKFLIVKDNLKYGCFETLMEAKFVLDLLNENDWIISHVVNKFFLNEKNSYYYKIVCDGLLMVDTKIKNNPIKQHGDYIFEHGPDEFFIINKRDFGSFESLEDAEFTKKLLQEYAWDVVKLEDNVFYNDDNEYYYKFILNEDSNIEISAKSLDKPFKSHGKYIHEYAEDNFVIRKDSQSIGVFSQIKDANFALKLLKRHDWDLNKIAGKSHFNNENGYYYKFYILNNSRLVIELKSLEEPKFYKKCDEYLYQYNLDQFVIRKNAIVLGYFRKQEDGMFVLKLLRECSWDVNKVAEIPRYNEENKKWYKFIILNKREIAIELKSLDKIDSFTKHGEFIFEHGADDFIIAREGIDYGSFESLEDAKFVKSLLIENKWKTDKIINKFFLNKKNGYYYKLAFDSRITITSKTTETPLKQHGKFIFEQGPDEFIITRKNTDYGSFESLDDAKFVLDLLIKNKWKVNKITNKFILNSANGYYYKLSYDSKLFITVKSKEENFKQHGKYIFEYDKDQFLIRKDGNTIGSFSNLIDAKFTLKLLKENKWDINELDNEKFFDDENNVKYEFIVLNDSKIAILSKEIYEVLSDEEIEEMEKRFEIVEDSGIFNLKLDSEELGSFESLEDAEYVRYLFSKFNSDIRIEDMISYNEKNNQYYLIYYVNDKIMVLFKNESREEVRKFLKIYAHSVEFIFPGEDLLILEKYDSDLSILNSLRNSYIIEDKPTESQKKIINDISSKFEKYIGKTQLEIYEELFDEILNPIPDNLNEVIQSKIIGEDMHILEENNIECVDVLLNKKGKAKEGIIFNKLNLPNKSGLLDIIGCKEYFGGNIFLVACYKGLKKNAPKGKYVLEDMKMMIFDSEDLAKFDKTYFGINAAKEKRDIDSLPIPGVMEYQKLAIVARNSSDKEAIPDFLNRKLDDYCLCLVPNVTNEKLVSFR